MVACGCPAYAARLASPTARRGTRGKLGMATICHFRHGHAPVVYVRTRGRTWAEIAQTIRHEALHVARPSYSHRQVEAALRLKAADFPPFPNPSPKEGEGDIGRPLSPLVGEGAGGEGLPPFPNPSPKEWEGDIGRSPSPPCGRGGRGRGPSPFPNPSPKEWEGDIGRSPSPLVGEGAGGEGP